MHLRSPCLVQSQRTFPEMLFVFACHDLAPLPSQGRGWERGLARSRHVMLPTRANRR
jgi:hypothetical protein